MEGRNGVQIARAREPHCLLARGLKVAPELDQFGAKSTHGGVFLGRIALRHEDCDLKARAPTREGQALAMIAARRQNDSANRRLALGERIDISQAATHLKRAGRQVVFVLDHDLGAEPLIEERPVQRRRRAQGLKHNWCARRISCKLNISEPSLRPSARRRGFRPTSCPSRR